MFDALDMFICPDVFDIFIGPEVFKELDKFTAGLTPDTLCTPLSSDATPLLLAYTITYECCCMPRFISVDDANV